MLIGISRNPQREGRRLAVGPVPGPLHAETRKLAEPGGNRNQLVQPTVSGTEKNPLARRPAARGQGLGPENESQSGPYQLALYPQTGTLEVRLQKKPDYAVRDLADSNTLGVQASQ